MSIPRREKSQWTPACWEWEVTDLSHLHDIDELDCNGLLELALRKWQAGRCAMCGKSADLRLDHDHKTGLVRGLLCHDCNTNEGMQQSADSPFEKYREKSPAMMLGIEIRYFNQFTGNYAEPEDELAKAERFKRAAEVISKLGVGDLDREEALLTSDPQQGAPGQKPPDTPDAVQSSHNP
jgi:hypothetical protein